MLKYLLAAVFGLAALVGGIRNVTRSMSGPQKLTCAEVERRVGLGEDVSGWLQLTGCEASLGDAAVSRLKISEMAREAKIKKGEKPGRRSGGTLYIPLRSVDAAEDAKVVLLLETTDDKLSAALAEPEDENSPEQVLAQLQALNNEIEAWKARRDYEGIAYSSLGKDEDLLREQFVDLLGERATLMRLGTGHVDPPWVQFGMAALLLGYVAFGIFRTRKTLQSSPEVDALEKEQQ